MKLLRRLIREICGARTDDLDDALATAQLAHLGQTRRSGEDYIEHPKEVARIVYMYYRDQDLCAAALLHDALEDAVSMGNIQSNEEMASLIAASFGDPAIGQEALRIVNRLTHGRGVPYDTYILTLLDDPDALKIKLSDILHNLQSAPSDKQKLKYATALQALQAAAGGIPGGINPGHWKALQSAAAGLVTQSESTLYKYIKELLTEQTDQQVYMHGTTQAGLEAIQKCNCLQAGKRGYVHAFFDNPAEEVENKEDITALFGGRSFKDPPVFIKFTTPTPPTRERGIAVVWNVEKLPIQILGIEA